MARSSGCAEDPFWHKLYVLQHPFADRVQTKGERPSEGLFFSQKLLKGSSWATAQDSSWCASTQPGVRLCIKINAHCVCLLDVSILL